MIFNFSNPSVFFLGPRWPNEEGEGKLDYCLRSKDELTPLPTPLNRPLVRIPPRPSLSPPHLFPPLLLIKPSSKNKVSNPPFCLPRNTMYHNHSCLFIIHYLVHLNSFPSPFPFFLPYPPTEYILC